ncbi:hypothetical protein OU995_06585 [Roseateles sp. SL47]|uniref:hypothetical protein n=1 Tax=Roseateles sp. SL47 TaxID=2995138 RepID=UPI00226E376E|nr:hypothetical protein [Roseateles sp. SL47]WAC74380.1 hypothetical protein OU995_06585 [Roseateles sp. SL47]
MKNKVAVFMHDFLRERSAHPFHRDGSTLQAPHWQRVVVGVWLMAAMAFAQAATSKQQDDALFVTSPREEARSRETAARLFKFAAQQFSRYADVMPLKVTVQEESWDDGRPPSFIHQGKFATFEAGYYLVAGEERVLQWLVTRSASFKLPSGIRMGQSQRQVLKALGPPTAMSKNSLLFEIGGEAIHEVFFNFSHDRLVEVSWAYGVAD